MKRPDRNLLQILLICLASVLAFLAVFRAGMLIRAIGYFLALISPITIGACIAFVLNVLLSLYEKKLPEKFIRRLGRYSRIFCICLTLLTVGTVIAVFVLLIYPELEETVTTVVSNIPGYASSLISAVADITGKTEAELMGDMNINWDTVSTTITSFIENYGHKLISGTLGVTGNVLAVLLRLCVSMVLAVWILLFKEKLGRRAKLLLERVFPKHSKSILDLGRYSSEVFSSFISGQLTEALILGSLCFVGMLIFRFPYALTTSVIITVSALVPIFGAFLGAGAGALLCLTSSFATAIWFLVYIIVLQQFETNVIYPKVMGKSVGLPGIWVLLSVTIGGNLFGAIGLLTAVPVCAILYTILNALLDKRIEKKNAAQKNTVAVP
ncbi:MAG: AI-2E family transporter [Clostridia bacterium]|nr:AI-2E family transporter [Clostridia bacterium]